MNIQRLCRAVYTCLAQMGQLYNFGLELIGVPPCLSLVLQRCHQLPNTARHKNKKAHENMGLSVI